MIRLTTGCQALGSGCLALALLLACGQPAAPTKANASGMSGWADWPDWPKVNAERMWSRAHARVWVDIHVAPDTVDAYRGGTKPMPRGSRVVKAIYKSRDATQPLRLTAMTKMGKGYDADDGDWRYAVLAADGVKLLSEGRIGMCIDCHILSEGDDYLYRPKGSGSWKDAFPGPPPRR